MRTTRLTLYIQWGIAVSDRCLLAASFMPTLIGVGLASRAAKCAAAAAAAAPFLTYLLCIASDLTPSRVLSD